MEDDIKEINHCVFSECDNERAETFVKVSSVRRWTTCNEKAWEI